MSDFPWSLGTIFDYDIAVQYRIVAPALACLAEHGYSRIQGSFIGTAPPDPVPFRRDLEQHGLQADSVHAPFNAEGSDFSVPDDYARDKAIANTKAWLSFTRDCGAEFLLLHSGDAPISDMERPTRFKYAAESLNRLANFAEQIGVRILIENLPHGYLPVTPDESVALLDAADHPALGFSLDTGHANLVMGDPVSYVARYGERLWSMHAHDNHGESDEHLAPGKGTVDWPAFLTALRDANYEGTFMFEWNGIYFINGREEIEALLDRLNRWYSRISA